MKLKHLICLTVLAVSSLIPSGISKAATYNIQENIHFEKSFYSNGHSVSIVDSYIEGLSKVENPTGFGCFSDYTWYTDGTNYFQLVVADGQYRVVNVCHVLNQKDFASTYEESLNAESPLVGDVTLKFADGRKLYKYETVANLDYLKSSRAQRDLMLKGYDNTFNTNKDFVVLNAANIFTSDYQQGDVYKAISPTSYWYLISANYQGGQQLFGRCVMQEEILEEASVPKTRGAASEMQIGSRTVLYTSCNETENFLKFEDKDGIRQVILPQFTPMFLFSSQQNFDMTVMDKSTYAFVNSQIASNNFQADGEIDSILRSSISNGFNSLGTDKSFQRFVVIENAPSFVHDFFVNGQSLLESSKIRDFATGRFILESPFNTISAPMGDVRVGLGSNGEVTIPAFIDSSVVTDGNRLIFKKYYKGNAITYATVEASFKEGYQFQEWCSSKDLAADSALTGEKDLTALSYEIYPWFVLDTEVEIDNLTYHIENKTRNSMSGSGVSGTVIASNDSVYTGDIEIPTSVAFNDEEVTVGSIDKDAFKNSTITSITLPDTISFVEDGTFTNLPTLKKVYVDSPVLRLANAFDKSIDLYTYYTYSAYKHYKDDEYTGNARAYSDVIQFNCNGGEIDESDLSQFVARQDGEYVYFLKSFYTLPIPIKEGSVFVGWFDNPECEGTPLRNITSRTEYTLQDNCFPLYAKWHVVSVPVQTDNIPEIDYDELNQKNQTDVEKEADIQQKAEEAAQKTLTETEARALADKQAQQKKDAEEKNAQEQAKLEESSQNESLEAYTSPIVKIRSAKSKSRKITVKFSCPVKVNGYEIQSSTSAKFKKKQTKSLTTASKTGTFKKMKKGKKYYVRVRAYVLDNDGQKVYGEWSDVKKVVVK